MAGSELRRRRLSTVELGDLPISLGVVVVRVDDDPSRQRAGRQIAVAAEGDRREDDLAEDRRILGVAA